MPTLSLRYIIVVAVVCALVSVGFGTNALAWMVYPDVVVSDEVFFPDVAEAKQTEPSVAFDGSTYFFAWTDSRWRPGQGTYNVFDVYGARMTADGTLLDPVGIPIVTTDDTQQLPLVVAVEGGFLVVWCDGRNGGSSISRDLYAALVDTNGHVLDPDGYRMTEGALTERTRPRAASDGTNALIVWAELREYGWDIAGVLIGPDGRPIAPGVFWISEWDATQDTPDVAWDGSEYVVVYMDVRNYVDSGEDVYATRVSADGAVMEPEGFPVSRAASDQDYPRVSCRDGRCLVVWDDAREMGVFRTEGAWIEGETVTPASGFAVCEPPCAHQYTSNRVLNAEEGFVAIWTDTRQPDSSSPYGAVVTSDQSVVPAGGQSLIADEEAAVAEFAADPPGFFGLWSKAGWPYDAALYGSFWTGALDPAGDPQALVFQADGQYAPRVAWGDGNGLIVWQDTRRLTYTFDVYATRVNADGDVLDTPAIPVYEGGDAWYTDVAFGGGNYFVMYKDPRLATSYEGTLIAPDGTNLHPGGIPLFDDIDEDGFALAFNGTNFVVVYEVTDWDYNMNYIYTRLVAADGSWFSPYPNLVVNEFGDQIMGDVACSQTTCLAVWHDLRDDPGDIYGARIRFNGTVANVGGSPIDAEPNAQSWPRVATDGEVFAVVWEDSVVYGHGSHIRATILDDRQQELVPPFAVSDAGARTQFQASVTWDGQAFAVTWTDTSAGTYRLGDGELYLARFLPDGTFLDEPRVIAPTDEVESDPEVAQARDGRLLMAYQRWDPRVTMQKDRVYARVVDVTVTTTSTTIAPTTTTASTTTTTTGPTTTGGPGTSTTTTVPDSDDDAADDDTDDDSGGPSDDGDDDAGDDDTSIPAGDPGSSDDDNGGGCWG